jgi:hypothetical protein
LINFTVLMTPQTTISLDALWQAALPEVIAEIKGSGYTVEEVEDGDPAQPAVTPLRSHQTYRLEPGPATLTAVLNPTDDGSIQFALTGPRFGMRFGTDQADPVLWMRLVTLGVRLGETYMVVPSVVDPDFVIGGSGSPETFLPG